MSPPILVPLLFLPLLAAQPEVSQKATQAVELLLQEKYAELAARFSPEMKKALSEDALRTGVAPRFRAFGAVKKILEPEVSRQGEFEIAIVPVEFEKAAVNIQVTFNKAGEVAGLFFRPRAGAPPAKAWEPPSYSKPEQFRSEEIVAGTGEWKLPGTLLVPSGKGPFPAVVLVHGSGPNDRDETVGANKPFRDLAEGLASRGIAVLRYEKRTRVFSARMAALQNITVREETVEDAVSAAALLRTRGEIDARRFVLGHSLGGYLAPRIAKEDPKLAGVIVLAGNTRPLEDLIQEQVAYIASLGGEPTPEQKRQMEQMKRSAERLRALQPGTQARPGELPFGVPVSYWLDLKGYDPAAEARSLKQPMLILQGERDYQVTMADFARWKEALKDRKDVTLRSHPALNHLFMAGEGKSKPAEYAVAGHVAAEVIDEIAAWILGR